MASEVITVTPSPGTAREKVRVARALFDLPLTAAAFQSGELSYSKARALTRIATPETEERLVNYAIPATALQADDHCPQLQAGPLPWPLAFGCV